MNIMGTLFDEWIQLFDERNFQNIKDEPIGLRAVTMLFVTIQKEFRKVEEDLGSKLQTYKLAFATKSCSIVKEEPVDNLKSKFISPPKENFKNSMNKIKNNSKQFLKSPTLDRHRKAILKRTRKPLGLTNISGVFPMKNVDSFSTPSKSDYSSKILMNASDDEDIFESSIIGVTPNIEVTKRSKNLLQSQRKRNNSKSTLKDVTLTQMFSEMNSKEADKKDETTMMDIDEILQKVENADKMDAAHSTLQSAKSTTIKISDSFVDNYDRIPEIKKTPTKEIVYKETVRGNEKKKLKGWSCKDCENFYKGMKLSEEELEKRMNDCSKHKSKFKPDDETIPGYWDLSIPSSSESEDEKRNSAVSPEASQDSLNESSIYCFFKK